MTIDELAEHGILADIKAGTVEVHPYTDDGRARGFDPEWMVEAVTMVSVVPDLHR